jgi:class 3 adenylate cyclase/tetratricopeptide (TPR) repeat protein
VITCPNCGEENPERFQFCGACGARLSGARAPAGEERKVVSVLFADLVGFTARSDRADPEDVRATLRPYHARVKREIERFGGTVEKFVGDAVMAVFGAPVGHEDDAERAVRSALRIVEAIPELNEARPGLELAVRVAVNTGEAVVSLEARPEQGEGIVAGDVVNTASRLQGAAPVGAAVVGETTYRATKDVIVYEELPPVALKGKAEAVPVWRAVTAKSRYVVEIPRAPTPFIGREEELALLKQTYLRSLREASVQLVTVTGEPGVGKSRLIGEFSTFVDDQPEIVFWRQGRCLPYGEGITFWALGEIVKAQTGILESDGLEEAGQKLAETVGLVTEDPSQRDWLKARLAPLVGTSAESIGTAEREESFAAWRTFLEGVASVRPLMLVIEDLHWADPAMLSFVEHLLDWSIDVPMLVLCSARPELYERVPNWGGGKRNSTTIALPPLSSDDTARLVSALLSEAVLPAETQSVLLERAGGNPLYAEEFVRMLTDLGILVRQGRAWRIATDGHIPVPESVQALIAARLDTLPPERKSLLHDASVVGKVFWSGAIASTGGIEEEEVRERLHELGRKELVRPSRTSSIEGHAEYAFWHILVRDVAYSQIPRAARAEKHRAVAEWIERIAGERVGDHAELLAHHYEQALDLARATGTAVDVSELENRARQFLVMAGDRALSLDVAKAHAYHSRALDLTPPGHPDRPAILVKAGDAGWQAGYWVEAQSEYEEAIRGFRELNDHRGMARAMIGLTMPLSFGPGGETSRTDSILAEAVELLEPLGPTPELARAYVRTAGRLMVQGRSKACLEWSEKGLALAQELGEEEYVVRVLQFRGIARCELGDLKGVDDLWESLHRGLDLGLGFETHTAYGNLSDWVWDTEGPAKGLELNRAADQFANRRGLLAQAMWGAAESTWMLYELGDWDEVLEVADQVIEWARDHQAAQHLVIGLTYRARVLAERGETATTALIEEFLPKAREIGDPQILVPALGVAALIRRAAAADEAVALIEELDRTAHDRAPWNRTWYLPVALRVALPEQLDLASRLMDGIESPVPHDRHALLQGRAMLAEAQGGVEEATGLYTEAVADWDEFGNVPEQGHALLGAGRCLLALGRRAEAKRTLQEAREIFQGLGARPALQEADTWLEQAATRTS